MEPAENPTLGQLERDGAIDADLALLYGRILGGNWRNTRLTDAVEAVIRKSGTDDRHTGTNQAA